MPMINYITMYTVNSQQKIRHLFPQWWLEITWRNILNLMQLRVLTLEMCVPRLLCTPQHFKHIKTPIFADLKIQLSSDFINPFLCYKQTWLILQCFMCLGSKLCIKSILQRCQRGMYSSLYLLFIGIEKNRQIQICCNGNTYAHFGSGAPQSAQMRLSVWFNKLFNLPLAA